MKFSVNHITRFDVGDIVYVIPPYYSKDNKIVKGVVCDIVLYYSNKKSNCLYYVKCDNEKNAFPYFEEDLYKTEYEAKIALGNMM